jgi:hypothetical protein
VILEYKSCQNKMHKAPMLRRPWKWEFDYYNVHVIVIKLSFSKATTKNYLPSFTRFQSIVNKRQVKKVKIVNNQEKTQCTKKVHEQTKNVYFIFSPLWNFLKILSGTITYKLHQLTFPWLMFFQLMLPHIDVLKNGKIPFQDHM